jgi:hypothetical protein
MRTRFVVLLGIIVAVAAFAAGAAVGGTLDTIWAWQVGDSTASVGRVDGSNDLQVAAKGDLDLGANHIRIGGVDGNFEFEHGTGTPWSHLNAYEIGGVGVRTPIMIGGGADGQDVLSLVVAGKVNQKRDLQQWQAPEGHPVAAIDSSGRLRIGQVTLATAIRKGHAVLLAVLPNGTKQILATGH